MEERVARKHGLGQGHADNLARHCRDHVVGRVCERVHDPAQALTRFDDIAVGDRDFVLPADGDYHFLAMGGGGTTGGYMLHMQRLDDPAGAIPIAYDDTVWVGTSSGQSSDAKTVRVARHDVEGLGADRARRPQDDHRPLLRHGTSVPY